MRLCVIVLGKNGSKKVITSTDAWYLMMFAFGLLCGWAIVKGLSDE